jgi:folate-binding Fe-S cluster repair protein YgfZ
VFLHLDGSGHTLPAVGDAVTLGERPVGHLTSVARHFEDGPIALALVKRNVPTDEQLDIAGVSAAQVVVVAP